MNTENLYPKNPKGFKHYQDFEVHDYECDVQGIVNNAVYLNYLEHARHKFLKTYNVDFVDMSKHGLDLVVIEIHAKYLSSLRHDDEFFVETEFKKLSKLKFLFIQTIYKKSDSTKPVLQAEITGCCLDRHSSRPVQIENSILAAL
jgi:acyl-CoA thioester hydrolase